MKKVIACVALLSWIALVQPVVAQSNSCLEPGNSVRTMRQKITAVSQNLDQLEPMAGDLISVALRELDRVTVGISYELYQQYLESIYRFSRALQQAHGSVQRIELQRDPVAGEQETITQRAKQANKRLTEIELMLLDAGPNLLNLLDNPTERVMVYKLTKSLNR